MANLKQCPDCGKDVSADAVSCQNCGKPFKAASTISGINMRDPVHIIGVVLCLLLLISAIMGLLFVR